MDSVLCEVFLVLSLHLLRPFGVVNVVRGDGCVVFFGGAGLGESDGSVVGGVHVPVECCAVETVVDLVEWVVVNVETVEFCRGCGRFVCVVWLGSLDECVWVDDGLLKEVGFSCVFCPRGVHGVEVDAVGVVFHKVEVSCKYIRVSVLWSNFPADVSVKHGTFVVLVVAGVVVDVDDL